MEYIIGVDVGTGSVRGALVNKSGSILKIHVENITTWNPKPTIYQQSSDQIWEACCKVINKVIEDVSPANIKGIGFDATCSLAVFDADGNPLPVEENGDCKQNIILWMDHRAKAEAEIINKTKHDLLKYVGGSISLEMMMPKILWLKRNNVKCWENAQHYFLLPDFLTWKCTGSEKRSLCSVVCKGNYEALPNGDSGWRRDFFERIQLGELAEDDWRKIGSVVINPGELCGTLSANAAKDLGLVAGVPVAASLIDAHAGGLGVMGCATENVSNKFETRLALISGSSTCHMLQTIDETYVPGVWGPYYNAMIPGMWLLEGGQSATGVLIDHIINTHPAAASIKSNLKDNQRFSEYLNCLLCEMIEETQLATKDELTVDTHVWPDFHGNRSPLADPSTRGMICGLTLATDEKSLALLYLATIQALAYGTKQILEEVERSSNRIDIKSVLICGGLSRNELFVQTHANVLGLPVLIPEQSESVILGAAKLCASVAGFYSSIHEAVLKMAGPAKHVKPNSGTFEYHKKKYSVFFEMLNLQQKSKATMHG